MNDITVLKQGERHRREGFQKVQGVNLLNKIKNNNRSDTIMKRSGEQCGKVLLFKKTKIEKKQDKTENIDKSKGKLTEILNYY